MIIDSPDPRNVEVIRSRNPVKRGLEKIVSDIKLSLRGDDERDRDDRRRDDPLDDTRSRMSSSLPPNNAEFRVDDRRAQIPQWILILFILQGGGAIYSWATMRSDINYARQELIRIEAKIDAEVKARVDDIKVVGLERDKDKDLVRDLVRDEIANQLLSRGVFRAQPNSNP